MKYGQVGRERSAVDQKGSRAAWPGANARGDCIEDVVFMSGGDRARSAHNLRALIDTYIHGCKPKTKIHAYKLIRQFSNKTRYLTPHRISMLLRDREDLQHTGRNEWVVVA